MIALVLVLALQDTAAYARAESLLAAGQVNAAIEVARKLAQREPDDPRVQLLLGRAYYARPITGRYDALTAFQKAARLAPNDPEPLYWQMRVGWYLGSDEGEVIARGAMLRLFELDPDYRDAWQRFGEIYHNDDIWRRADRALARHGDQPAALLHRAELALALGEPGAADSLLARRPPGMPDIAAFLIRAEAGFDAGRDSAGYAWYDSALVYADYDSTDALWGQVWMIASPEEAARYDSTGPGERRAFFEHFWATRDPNVFTAANERIAEHYRRLAYTRHWFKLLHPLTLYHRSARYRALSNFGARAVLGAYADSLPDLLPTRTERLPAAAGLGADPGAVGDTAHGRTMSSLAGLDARGLVWIRQGPPDLRVYGIPDPLRPMENVASPLDLEGWTYYTPRGPLTIAFARGSTGFAGGGMGGDFIFFPTSPHQVASARRLLEGDRTTLPAPFAARLFIAYFRADQLGRTDLVFASSGDSAAAALWDDRGDEVGRGSGAGPFAVSAPPGRLQLGFNADSGGRLGRLRAAIVVPDLWTPPLALSSLLLAPGDSLGDRAATLACVPPGLVFAAGAPLSAYSEIYGLGSDGVGRAHYTVRYTFERVQSAVGRMFGVAQPVVFEFTRDVIAGEAVREQVVLAPGRVPGGRYRVTVAVTDLSRNVKSQSVALDVTLR
ncbi:MAG TPA: GWxTD domain-containing protein [Gemmatimonadales bacterium]